MNNIDAPTLPNIKVEPAKKPASLWFNWWHLSRPVPNLAAKEMLGPGRCRSHVNHKTKDLAETAAYEWINAHEAIGCSCGFNKHCYLGAYEDGKAP